MRTLSDLGEFGFIEEIRRLIDGSGAARHVVVGPGDDAAVLRPPPGRDLVVSTDALVENVHFRFATQDPRAVGRRALIANLSDLAAMGAAPLGCVAALSAPRDLPLRVARGLVRGMVAEADAQDCPLVGGNLSRASETSLAITVFGAVARGGALRRHAVRAGDHVFVTGTLGGQALAVARAEREGRRIRSLPTPRLRAGRALSRMKGVGGCIDVSDGLAPDLGHLLEGSGLGVRLELGQVPRPPGFDAACRRLDLDPDALCLGGGEDYELAFTLRPAAAKRLGAGLSRRLGVRVSEVGRVTREPGLAGLPEGLGWSHF